METLPILFAAAALIALIFLFYGLINLKKLQITLAHPRVLVEGGLFFLFILVALALR